MLDRWLRPRVARGSSPLLVCFSNGGCGASAYRGWRERIPVEVVAVQLPGREDRLGEPPFESLPALIAPLMEVLESLGQRRLVLFGHSMGALVAFEAARRLSRPSGPTCAGLVVSAHRAPHLPRRRPPMHQASDQDLVELLRSYGGTPAEILASDEFLALAIPTLRADLKVIETYTFEGGPPLSCPLVAMGGEGDPDASVEDLDAWRAHAGGPFAMRALPGGHFYHREIPDAFFGVLGESLAPLLGELQPALAVPPPRGDVAAGGGR